jgi:hypothetical protein
MGEEVMGLGQRNRFYWESTIGDERCITEDEPSEKSRTQPSSEARKSKEQGKQYATCHGLRTKTYVHQTLASRPVRVFDMRAILHWRDERQTKPPSLNEAPIGEIQDREGPRRLSI